MPLKSKFLFPIVAIAMVFLWQNDAHAQDLPRRYATLELFTNTPCPICASQNPGLFNRLQAFEGQYHLISFYPGKPYQSCVFYQSNISENTSRWQFYTGDLFGTPTVAINGIDFKSAGNVSTTVLDAVTGNESWLNVKVEESSGTNRTVDITLTDVVGGSLSTGKLFAVIVEKEVVYTAPNGETGHHNVFRQFLGPVAGENVDLSSGEAVKTYSYNVDEGWEADQVYVIAWLMDPDTKEILNSGTRFDPDLISGIGDVDLKNQLNIYPNPSSSDIHIELPEDVHDSDLKIYDTTGKIVFHRASTATTQIHIDCSNWPEGIYLIQVKTGNKEMIGKVRVVK